ncbi:hypothetical protein OAF63_04700 [Saprospiraceae bacterium]|jgi:hypothetical protein|nr:hypothetical protein [Bacteroidota bacterium]MDB4728072.1 hypothetical protein [Saprospiraceae bacterium]MDF1865806.1 hypothetical protein [Saprospiraceae bacterium]
MKILKIISVFTVIGLFASCAEEYNLDDNFTVQELPGYVAFNAPGLSATVDDLAVTEDDGTASLRIECPTGTLSDITVGYEISGNAVEGVDYNISGASGNSGSIVIAANPEDVVNFSYADLTIDILTDDEVDGEKTLTITLVSATNDEGTLAVGRGGTDFLKSTSVIIADVN